MATQQNGIRGLVEEIAQALVDKPDQVRVNPVEGEQVTVLELRVAPGEVGKVIGRQGRLAHSMRTIMYAAAAKAGRRRYQLEILE